MTGIYIATEDVLSENILTKLVRDYAPNLNIDVPMRRGGFGYLKKKTPGLIATSNHVPVILLTDLDANGCAPSLIDEWTNGIPRPVNFLFRVTIHQIEAWLMADRINISKRFKIPLDKLSQVPETFQDSKTEFLKLVTRHGTKDDKDNLLPAKKSNAGIGLGYNRVLSDFVEKNWDPNQAAQLSPSLKTTISRIQQLSTRFQCT